MKKICLYLEIHQIVHLKRYRFFDIGRDHYYYDDYANERSITYIAENSYMPALNALHEMMVADPGFKVAFSISGVGMEQLEMHAPQVIEKLLKSAIANAENNHFMNKANLYVAEIYANQGPTLKRIRPAAKGSAVRIRKRTSHITIVLKERQ